MTNEQRIVQFVIGRLKPSITSVNVTQNVSKLVLELEVLDKLLSSLPCYDRDTAIDIICGKDIADAPQGEVVIEC